MKGRLSFKIACILLAFVVVWAFSACDDSGDNIFDTEGFKTESGVGYYAEGYDGVENSVFTISDGFRIVFEKGAFPEKFNRTSLVYSSDKVLRVTVFYSSFWGKKSDDFYLEAGENVTFNGLISDYLKNKKGRKLSQITFDVLDGERAEFSLHDISVQTVELYSKGDYFIENDRYRLGIRLAWGGGINYIQDKTCGIDGLTNLCNDHDTGRLIQQSYYGTAGNDEYTPGVYNGYNWTYNPVQGGDVFGNASRLIDVSVSGNSVYIKAQPQDWSLDNALTPSYMENTYTLCDDGIKVDNRFIDFSGWEHRYAHQELPAFYTVSYLDDFVYYNGDEPWSGKEVCVEPDLPFWGGEQHSDCVFDLKKGNTETWCAWISSESGFGIGLYVPNVDTFLAGRFSFDGSKASDAVSSNYVAPLNMIKLVSFDPIEYSYLITTGSLASIRSTFENQGVIGDNSDLGKMRESMRVD